MNRENYLTPSEVAKRLGKSHKTIMRWIHSGQLKATIVNKYYYISKEDLAEYESLFIKPFVPTNDSKYKTNPKEN